MNDPNNPNEVENIRIIRYLDGLRNEELKMYIKWKIAEIIIMCQFFFAIYVVIYVYLSFYSGSVYYWAFYSVIPIIHLISTFMFLIKKPAWSVEDTRTLLYFNCSDMLSALTSRKTNFRHFTTFMSVKILLWFYAICIWMKPLNQYLDLVTPPSNSSSCTSVYSYTSVNAYNPEGYFNLRLNYSNSLQLKYCPMDQTWAWPNFNTTIQGYTTSPLSSSGVDACSGPKQPFGPGPLFNRVNGFIDANICLNPFTGKTKSYPSPVLGIRPPITQATQLSPVMLCNGNTNDNVCIDADGSQAYITGSCGVLHRIGKPRKICPYCLNYWRTMSGDFTGPPGYEHCSAYDGTSWNNPFCAFCPGRGYGWLAREAYTQNQLLWNLILGALYLVLLPIEYMSCLIMVSRYIPAIRNYID